MSEQKIFPFLMFEGQAGDAMAFYLGLFTDARMVQDARYGPENPAMAGKVLHAILSLKGQQIMCIDSSVNHAFGMTPAVSLYVSCDDEAEFDRLFAGLSEGAEVRMPPANYGFSRKFAWTDDRFGVSWQLNLV